MVDSLRHDGSVPDPGTASYKVAWRPDQPWVKTSLLRRFMDRVSVPDLAALRVWAGEHPDSFWKNVVEDLGIEWYEPYKRVMDTSQGIAWTRWFTGGRFNIAHNCLDKHAAGPNRDKAAIIWEGEDGAVRRLTYHDAWEEANRLCNALAELGLKPGERVGLFMPMIPETAVALLALAKFGAMVIPIFSGYGPEAVAMRLRDAEVRVLICADGFWRRGKPVPMKETADAAMATSSTVEKTIVVRRLGASAPSTPWTPGRDLWWDELVSRQPATFETRVLESDSPLMIIYTSGTTGRPKGAQHIHAGFPVKSAQDLAHCFDLRESDTLFWFTDIGWMMAPWMIYGTSLLGATMFLYEGTPDHPGPDRLWSMIERHKITHLGISPTAIRALMAHDDSNVTRHDLSSLRVLGSSGEPWNPEPWYWFFERVGGGRCPVINYSGGTEVSGGILGCFPTEPIKPCSFSGPVPGMSADVLDEAGRPVRNAVGELVLRGPWVGMTNGFWRDRQRYIATYWSRWPAIWVHGDWAYVDPDGFWYIHGRSDDTLKVAGKRVGPAEVESAIVAHAAVREAAVVGVPHEIKGQAIVGFAIVRPASASKAGPALEREVIDYVASALGKSLKPERIHFVADLPKTRNGKIMRRVIRAAYLDENPGDLSSLENPGAVEIIRELGRITREASAAPRRQS
ncbi:MAG: AMP-binding protein [Bacillota bacterium]